MRDRMFRGDSVRNGIVALALVLVGLMAQGRDRAVSLDGLWEFRFEKGRSMEDVVLPAFQPTDKMVVPGSWETMSHWYGQRGTGCYRRSFELDRDVVNAFLVIDGAGIRSKFWIDGREIGVSQLLFSKIEFATGPLKAGRHEIVAAVDSMVDNAKVKLFWNYYDLYAYGGFHHGIWLETQERPVEIRKVVVRTRDYRKGLVELEVLYAAEGPADFTARVSFDGRPPVATEFRNRRVRLVVPEFRTWSPSAPNLHTVTVEADGQRLSARFGIRQVGTADRRITLNGRPIYLKGVNRYEMHCEFGCTTSRQLMYEDVRNIKDLGGNFVRGSCIPQTDDFLSLCDELGVLVWEESLGWQNNRRQFRDPEFRRLQVEQTRLMVRHSINHPSIIITGFLNEPQHPGLPECRALVDELIAAIRAEDTGHLVTFACSWPEKDISNANTDIIAYNAYPCWYSDLMTAGTPEEMRRKIARRHGQCVAAFRKKYGDKPIIVGETGVKADYGAHDPRGRAQYTEDFQAEYERIMLEEIFANDEICGVTIWQFTDSKTYTRIGSVTSRSYGLNTGGIYDLYRRPKMAVEEVRKLFSSKPEYPNVVTKGE